MRHLRHLLIIASLAAAPLLSPSSARAQTASDAETAVLSEIAKCLVVGLPEDWQRAQVVVELKEPGAPDGEVRYLFSRTLARDKLESFKPCDEQAPARAMVGLRGAQPPEKRGWRVARFLLNRDGKFDLSYDYPK
jgi:hypothetical protein